MTVIAQRYVKAVGSSNLKHDDTHFDTDVLMAVAMSSSFGSLMFRVKYFNDAASYQRLLHQWTWIVSCKAIRRKWPDHVPVDKVAYLSLTRWISSVCPACTGRRMETVFNTPTLSDKACRVCQGTGEAPLRADRRIIDYVKDMLEELHEDERKAKRRAVKKLGREA